MSSDHPSAFLDLLDADAGPPKLRWFDGFVPPDTNPPYVVVYFILDAPSAEEDPQASNLVNESLRRNCWAYAHSVGGNAAAARAVDARVRAAWLDKTPTVTGRSCSPIRNTENQPAVRDETTGYLVADVVSVYRLSSMPA